MLIHSLLTERWFHWKSLCPFRMTTIRFISTCSPCSKTLIKIFRLISHSKKLLRFFQSWTKKLFQNFSLFIEAQVTFLTSKSLCKLIFHHLPWTLNRYSTACTKQEWGDSACKRSFLPRTWTQCIVESDVSSILGNYQVKMIFYHVLFVP